MTPANDAIAYLRKLEPLNKNYKMTVNKTERGFLIKLMKGNALASRLHVYVDRLKNGDITAYLAEGKTEENFRGRQLGTIIRALGTKAAFVAGASQVNHVGANLESLALKSYAKKHGISLNEAAERVKTNTSFTPISTKIVRNKLGFLYHQNQNESTMTKNHPKTKLNAIVSQFATYHPSPNKKRSMPPSTSRNNGSSTKRKRQPFNNREKKIKNVLEFLSRNGVNRVSYYVIPNGMNIPNALINVLPNLVHKRFMNKWNAHHVIQKYTATTAKHVRP
jgi:hypothetical protein